MVAIAGDLPSAAIGMIKRHIKGREIQTEQTGGAGKGRVNHPVQLKIRFQRGLIEIMFGGAAFFGVITPVPWGQIAVDAIVMHHLRQHVGVGVGLALCRLPHIHQQAAHSVRRFGHFGFQFEIRKCAIAQKICTFFAQGQRFGGDGAVVGVTAIGTACLPSEKGLLAQVAARRELQERHDERSRQGDNRPCYTFFLAGRTGRTHHKIGQALQIIFGQLHEPAAFICQQVLGKLRAQHGQPRLDVFHALFFCALQRGARTDKPAMGQHQNPRLFVS